MIFGIWNALGCLPTLSTTLKGTVEDSDGNPLNTPTIEVRLGDGTLYETIAGNPDGTFTAILPSYQSFFLVLSDDERSPTSFSGYSGEGEFNIPSGTLWTRNPVEITEVQNQYGTCFMDNHIEGTGFIDGAARLYIDGQNIEDLPLMTTATATATSMDDQEMTGCYHPDIDESTGDEIITTETGDSGEYAIFGLTSGVYQLNIQITVEGTTEDYPFVVFVPENGSTPMYPTLIPFLEE